MSFVEHRRSIEGIESIRSLDFINKDHQGYGSIDNELQPSGLPTESTKEEQLTYTHLLRENPNFRYFLMSYVVNKMVSEISIENRTR